MRRAALALALLLLALALAPTPEAASGATWPPLSEATIRPGVSVDTASGQCTSNFLFTSADHATRYLGLAAHCVDGMPIGEQVRIANGAATGRLAYSSWRTMTLVGEADAPTLAENDFALIRIDDAYAQRAHPAMLHYGGPTGLADADQAETGDAVVTYGNSGLRLGLAPLSPHEGFVVSHANEWSTYVVTATPGIPGDSGSGVMTRDGRALGVLVTLNAIPPGVNGVTHLDDALDYARAHGGMDVRLATWHVLTPPTLAPVG